MIDELGQLPPGSEWLRRLVQPEPWNPGPQPDYQNREPSGYVVHDPYAPAGYPPPNGGYQPPYQQNPYGPPLAPYAYAYDAGHPPRPGVGPVDSLKLFFKNYAVFHGRASRSEYWWMYLWGGIFNILMVMSMFVPWMLTPYSSDPPTGTILLGVLYVLLSLGITIPTISLQVRRLHDAGFSGYFTLLGFVPYLNSVGWVVPFVMSFFPSTPNGIKYDNPNGTQPTAR